ncbi:FlgO family outer membrane protein [Desulfovibrio legallii]|uniref:FlgO domain-containing protein n=1 Tax=Desulfovibrio legallii TaxID=571438 RepID=A0A1G7I4A1_9BACT|nr:FlgO family outer membrane protein [Desulfovibrio legallii]SDF07525.1 hypothetical protein SAMN05192586_101148 [Desulfovibrio legallii]
MYRWSIVLLVLAALLFPLAAAAGNVPRAADSIAKQMDEQLMMRYAGDDPGMTSSERKSLARARIMILGTTPANINNLEESSPLARQMTEEVARWLVNKGYRFQEIRRGSVIRFDQRRGEFYLTRDVRKLAATSGTGQAVLAGTYVVSREQVRFSMRLIHTTSGEVLAMGTATVPITDDMRNLVRDRGPGAGDGLTPTVRTRLQ